MTQQETDPDLLRGSKSLLWRHESVVARSGAGGSDCGDACMGSFEGDTIIFIASTIVWSQVNSREGTELHPSTENWIKIH